MHRDEDSGPSWPVWVLIAVVVVLAAVYLPPLTRASTAADLCLAQAPTETAVVSWSLAPLPFPHWQCTVDGSSEVIDLGWWPVAQ